MFTYSHWLKPGERDFERQAAQLGLPLIANMEQNKTGEFPDNLIFLPEFT